MDRLGVRRRINHYLPEGSGGGDSADWIKVQESSSADDEAGGGGTGSSGAPSEANAPPPRRNEAVAMLPTGVGQPVGKKRRFLAFSTEVDIDERRRRKRAATREAEARDRPSEAASSSSSGNNVMSNLVLPADEEGVAMDGIFKISDDKEEQEDADEDMNGMETSTQCRNSPFHINAEVEPSLTQLIEEGLDDAAEVSDNDLI